MISVMNQEWKAVNMIKNCQMRLVSISDKFSEGNIRFGSAAEILSFYNLLIARGHYMPFKLDISCDIIIETTDIYQCNVLFMIKAYLFCFFSLHGLDKCARFSFKTKGNIYLPLTK